MAAPRSSTRLECLVHQEDKHPGPKQRLQYARHNGGSNTFVWKRSKDSGIQRQEDQIAHDVNTELESDGNFVRIPISGI
jgi:hypothetical protein